MAKSKPSSKSKKTKNKEKSILNRVAPTPTKSSPPPNPLILCAEVTKSLEENNVEKALILANLALEISSSLPDPAAKLPALSLLGEINVLLGDISTAQKHFLEAVTLDPNGTIPEEQGGGAEKFLWLAQLSEVGGAESVSYFEKGANSLRHQIQLILDTPALSNSPENKEILEEKKRKLATALCGIVEVYMTDLSWENDAESRCEALVTEATLVAEEAAEPWQTLASVRISQMRMDDAKQALKRSMDVWKDVKEGDFDAERKIPDFPTRVSLARLLVEAEMEEDAVGVVERLVAEDDEAVEVWYLGGWALYVLGEKCGNGDVSVEANAEDGNAEENKVVYWASARRWLGRCIELFDKVGYEDERLGEHARELVGILDGVVGEGWEDEEDDDEEDEEEEGVDGDGDEDMMES